MQVVCLHAPLEISDVSAKLQLTFCEQVSVQSNQKQTIFERI